MSLKLGQYIKYTYWKVHLLVRDLYKHKSSKMFSFFFFSFCFRIAEITNTLKQTQILAFLNYACPA